MCRCFDKPWQGSLEDWIIKPPSAHLNCVGTLSSENQLTGNDFQKIEKSIKVFLNEKDPDSWSIIQRAYGSEAPGPGLSRGLVTVRKYKPIVCTDTVRQHLHFISGSVCIYLQFHHTVAPSKLKSYITAAVSFCCFWKISSKDCSVLGWSLPRFHIKPNGTE